MRTLLLCLTALFTSQTAFASPRLENKHWESACGGSNIEITTDDGEIVAIDAYVEHFSEGRQWICHFKDGKIVSALFKHFTVKRVAEGDAGQFSIKTFDDFIKVFHFPKHQIEDIDPKLKSDLEDVLKKAMQG